MPLSRRAQHCWTVRGYKPPPGPLNGAIPFTSFNTLHNFHFFFLLFNWQLNANFNKISISAPDWCESLVATVFGQMATKEERVRRWNAACLFVLVRKLQNQTDARPTLQGLRSCGGAHATQLKQSTPVSERCPHPSEELTINSCLCRANNGSTLSNKGTRSFNQTERKREVIFT